MKAKLLLGALLMALVGFIFTHAPGLDPFQGILLGISAAAALVALAVC